MSTGLDQCGPLQASGPLQFLALDFGAAFVVSVLVLTISFSQCTSSRLRFVSGGWLAWFVAPTAT